MVELRYFNANVRFRILLSYLNNMYEFTLAKFFNLFWFISCFNMFLLQNWQSYSTSKYTFFFAHPVCMARWKSSSERHENLSKNFHIHVHDSYSSAVAVLGRTMIRV